MRRRRAAAPLVAAAVVAVAVALTGCSDGTEPAASSSPASPASSTTTESSGAPVTSDNSSSTTTGSIPSSDVIPPPGFTKVVESFDHGEVTVFVPASWTDVDRVQLGNGEPRLHVAPDVTMFLDGTFTTPGLRIDAFAPVHNDGLDTSRPKETLDSTVSSPPDEGQATGPLTQICTRAADGDFPADLDVTSPYTGNFSRFRSCAGAGSALVVVAGPPDRSFQVIMQVNAATPADESALPTIARSLMVRNFP